MNMKRIAAALFGLAVLAAAGPAAAQAGHPHPCPPRNKHCRPVKPPVPPAGCTWVVGSAIGDIPRCVPTS